MTFTKHDRPFENYESMVSYIEGISHKVLFLRYGALKTFAFWPLLTFIDLWPLTITNNIPAFIFEGRHIYSKTVNISFLNYIFQRLSKVLTFHDIWPPQNTIDRQISGKTIEHCLKTNQKKYLHLHTSPLPLPLLPGLRWSKESDSGAITRVDTNCLLLEHL